MSVGAKQAVLFGELIEQAYLLDQIPMPTLDLSSWGFALIDVIFCKDVDQLRPFGIVAEHTQTGETVVAFRGTEGWAEWAEDADFVLDPSPMRAGARTERGFTRLYGSMRGSSGGKINIPSSAANVTICGHSLGGALATLLAAELAAPLLVTFGSPRVGDDAFALWAETRIGEVVRYSNQHDIVPTLPAPIPILLPYVHVGEALPLIPSKAITNSVSCHHSLQTYLFALDPSRSCACAISAA